MENKIYIDSLGYNFLEPILVEKQDNKIIITEEDLKKAINQAYEAGKNSVGYIKPIQNTYPTSPHYWTEIMCSNQGGLNE